MEDKYVVKSGKKLRYGYTTGSCATAASKAAAIMALENTIIKNVEIDTPKGWKLNIQIVKPSVKDGVASCAVVKDSGDDPDITMVPCVF